MSSLSRILVLARRLSTDPEFVTKVSSVMKSMIVADGRALASCVMRSIKKIKCGGAILVDNSERTQYGGVQEHLRAMGFLETKFRSLGPSNTYVWETTVFRKVNS